MMGLSNGVNGITPKKGYRKIRMNAKGKKRL
jgi:hypothetical protein